MTEIPSHKVTPSANGFEALEIFKSRQNEFDLIITDQIMPDVTGMKLAEEILRIRHAIPIILCTGYSDFNQEKAKAKGIQEFVMKPVSLPELAKTIRHVLDKPNHGLTGR